MATNPHARLFHIRVTPAQHQAFKRLADSLNTTMAALLGEMVKARLAKADRDERRSGEVYPTEGNME